MAIGPPLTRSGPTLLSLIRRRTDGVIDGPLAAYRVVERPISIANIETITRAAPAP